MKVNEIVYFHFTVFDGDGITPLTGQALSITSVLRYNNTISGVSVTIAEIASSGSYYASFIPTAVGYWDVRVTNPDSRVVGQQYKIEINDLDDLKAAMDEVINLLENKMVINEANSTLNLYDDSGDNIIKTWPLTNKDGNNVVLTGTGPANRGKRTT